MMSHHPVQQHPFSYCFSCLLLPLAYEMIVHNYKILFFKILKVYLSSLGVSHLIKNFSERSFLLVGSVAVAMMLSGARSPGTRRLSSDPLCTVHLFLARAPPILHHQWKSRAAGCKHRLFVWVCFGLMSDLKFYI